jgi:hypothetical protein
MLGITMGLAVRVMAGIEDSGVIQKTAQANIMTSASKFALLHAYRKYNIGGGLSTAYDAFDTGITVGDVSIAGHPFARGLGWARIKLKTPSLANLKLNSPPSPGNKIVCSATIPPAYTNWQFHIVVAGGPSGKAGPKANAESGPNAGFDIVYYYVGQFSDDALGSPTGEMPFSTVPSNWQPFKITLQPSAAPYPW